MLTYAAALAATETARTEPASGSTQRDCASFVLYPDGRISNWNAPAEQMLGYSEEQAPVLRGIIICPDRNLSVELQDTLTETHRIGIMRALGHYPTEVDLTRFLRATGPNVVFLSVETVKTALELATRIEGQAPETQI